MTIKIKYNRAFDVEDVCIGDVLIDRAENDIIYVVLTINLDAEEYICMRVNKNGGIKSLIERIGFECVNQYLKIDIDDSNN